MYLGLSEADNQHAQWLLEIGTRSTMDNNEIIQVSQSITDYGPWFALTSFGALKLPQLMERT